MLTLLILVNIAFEVPFVVIPNSSGNNISNFNKFDEAIKAFDKAI